MGILAPIDKESDKILTNVFNFITGKKPRSRRKRKVSKKLTAEQQRIQKAKIARAVRRAKSKAFKDGLRVFERCQHPRVGAFCRAEPV